MCWRRHPAVRNGGDRVGIDDTKTRKSGRDSVHLQNCPTQAKSRLEWATRLNFVANKWRKMLACCVDEGHKPVLGIMAAILARKLAQYDGGTGRSS